MDYEPLGDAMAQSGLESRIVALEEKLASYDVRLKVLENLDAQADSDEFAYFWKQYPRKVGKGHARSAFVKACKKASFDQIMDGLGRYKKDKPDKTDWKHPATWLNSEGWEDNWTGEVASGEPKAPTTGPHTDAAVKALAGVLRSRYGAGAEKIAGQVREYLCSNVIVDLGILLACCADTATARKLRPLYHNADAYDMTRWQNSYRQAIDDTLDGLGYERAAWPEVDWG